MKKIFFKFMFVAILSTLFMPITAAEISQGLGSVAYSKKISMDFQDANMKDVLKIFSQQSGLNFIASDEIKDRTITLFLEDVPVEEALERILKANNLTYETKEGTNIFIVKEITNNLKTMTKIFFLKYASVSNSKIKSEISGGLVRSAEFQGTSGGETGTGAGATTAAGSEGVSSIKEIVENVISELGKVVEDPRTNSLIVTDKVEQFPVIERTIAYLDVPLPQVLIEVEMLDVSKDLVDKIGVNWNYTTSPLAILSGANMQTKFPFPDNTENSRTKTLTMGTLNFAGLDIALEILTTDTDTKYLARPRILTLSNETAEIKIVTDEAIGTVTERTGEGAGAGSTTEAERAETGVALRVTPQVNTELGEITMFVEPTVSEATTSSLGSSYRDPERRQTKSVLRIKDGETIVIGGLIRTRTTEVITKIPVLGDIPFLGAAFRHRNKSRDEDRELMIFITPHIIEETKLTSISKSANTLPPVSREQEFPKSKMREVNNTLSRFERKLR